MGDRIRKITVVGAGHYGSTTTQLLAGWDIVDEVVMVDIVEGLPQGLALDLNQSRVVEGHRTRVVGVNDYAATAGSDLAVITAGLPRRPGMTRMDLLGVNAKIVRQVTEQLMEHSPEAVLIVVTNPLDQMTCLAAEVSGLPYSKVMGQAGILDTSRFVHFIAERVGADISEVAALTLGSHGETMVPVPSRCSVNGTPLTEILSREEIEEIVHRTREGGAEIVAFLKTGGAYYAPSAAAAVMARSVIGDEQKEWPVCAWVEGQYGIDGVFLGVPARLGAGGVEEVVELPLAPEELAELHAAADAVRVKVAQMKEIIN